ncbi:2-oxo-4-hydroxy-4-carboxy-5-ureidoimidazoline decarboxylase [Jatrophihabitans sp. GAS493]|uniref:2-oxo-4-hydroxy-4-carboxy-5-ureidoimidazoline decarboxylase n=1 Tax=Jatrophihabitans sp. GAS493 TaxID=1907575 RepID=UPI000BB9152C|nr:2-oxo-4-hydroxy-4-carboxy-5-ureidoimidazoline decarboxylase [Jatrophihabitans sp. GAS493]SOD71153.1 2-oxo-4-hydroxy-4-carboxy-5-ureidoimidazoline decarboxylase [Jatrophihabitans sp. GAS493]
MSEANGATAPPTLTVGEFDGATAIDAAAELLPCCASRRWITEVVNARPFATLEVLTAASDQVLAGLGWEDVLEALDAHPRIGERVGGADRESGWSRAEQAGAAGVDEATRSELLDGNRLYEEKFGFVFLICATGLSTDEMLMNLNARLVNDEESERDVVATELRKIVRLRLAKSFSPDDDTIAL